MNKKRAVMRIILPAIVIAGYGIAASGAPAAAASTTQPPTSVHQAAKGGKIADVKSLISKGADVNAKDASGQTALHCAASNGHKEIVEVLLTHGADVNARAGYLSQTAAESAMWANHNKIVRLLINRGTDISPLHFATHMKDQAKAKSLIEGGADVNKRTQYGTTPLHIAAEHGVINITDLLIDHGANVNAKDNWDWTVLHYAVYASKDMVKLLIAKGADVNAKDGDGWTPLYYVMKTGHREIAELLLSEQIRLLSGDLAQIALARKGLQQLTNHATPFEKKLLDIEELLVRFDIEDLMPVLEWDELNGLKIKEVLDSLAEQNKEYFTKNPEPQSGEGSALIVSLLKNAINEFLEAGKIFDESDAAQDDDALFSKMAYELGQRQRYQAQRIFTRLIKNLGDWQDKVAQLEERVSSLDARLHKERHEFSKMGENNYKIFQVDTEEVTLFSTVSGKGDVNNDGFNDILVIIPTWNNRTGRALLFYGGKDIDFSSPDMIFEGENEGDNFGGQSAVFADINNDGYDDIIIGASGSWKDPVNRRVYIYYCGPDMNAEADIILEGEVEVKGRFGFTVAAGDIDNDGYMDILVGAQNYDKGRGRVYLFWGGETMDSTADLILEGEGFPEGKSRFEPRINMMVQGWFGRRIDASEDVNGDGYKDILIGARYAGDKFNGSVYLFLVSYK